MKLSVQNVVDWLEEHAYTVHSSIATTQAHLAACRWLYSDDFRHGVLYVEPPEDGLAAAEPLVTVVTSSNDILRVETRQPEELFNTINALFYLLADWERRLLECILYRRSLQDLVNVADEIFRAPMIVDGIDGQCYGITQQYSVEIHETWRMRMENDAESYDFVHRNEERAFSKRLVRSFFPEFNESEIWPGNTMYSNLFYNGQRVGFIVLYEYQHKMRPGDLYYLYIFARIVEKHIAQYPEKYCYTSYLEFFFFTALYQQEKNWEKLEIIFRYNHWNSMDPYCIYYLLPHDQSEECESENAEAAERLTRSLRLRCPDAVCIPYQGTVTVLVNLRDKYTAERYEEQIVHSGMHRGKSMIFRDIRFCRGFHLQAVDAAQTARERNLSSLDAQCGISRKITRELRQSSYAMSYIPLPLRRLLQYDEANKSELVHTLRAIVLCNLNSTDAAHLLGLHRNTLLQRMKKIDRILGERLENIVEKNGIFGILLFCDLLAP